MSPTDNPEPIFDPSDFSPRPNTSSMIVKGRKYRTHLTMSYSPAHFAGKIVQVMGFWIDPTTHDCLVGVIVVGLSPAAVDRSFGTGWIDSRDLMLTFGEVEE